MPRAKNKRFVDTSVLINYLTGYELENIGNHSCECTEWCISTYIKCETRRRLLRDADFLYRRYQNRKSESDVDRSLARLPARLHRKLVTVLSVRAHILKRMEELNYSYTPSERFDHIKYHLRNEILTFIARIEGFRALNATNCAVGLEKLSYDKNKKKFNVRIKKILCSNKTPLCNIARFFEKNRDNMAKMLGSLLEDDELKKDEDKLITALRKILDKEITLPEQKTCWDCGDVVIASEAPYSYIILHRDKAFRLYGAVLGKDEVYIYVKDS
jgi:hypothetical protein